MTSHIIITVSLALLVFLTVVIYGFWKNGLHFFKLFVPSGIPIFILPLVVFIEVFSFFLRPISHSVRLFANMLAGHIALKVFASFIPLLAGLGILGMRRRRAAARHGDRADRARAAGRVPAGLRVHDPHLHLSQRCDSPGPLTPNTSTSKRSFHMDPIAAKYIGAGIACIGMGGAGVGVGAIFGHYLAAALRNPSAAQGQFGNLIFGFAVTEALGIFSLLIALLLLFALVRPNAGAALPPGQWLEFSMAEQKATSAHTEQPGGHKGAFPPFAKETFASQLVWLVDHVRRALSR